MAKLDNLYIEELNEFKDWTNDPAGYVSMTDEEIAEQYDRDNYVYTGSDEEYED